MQIHDSELKLQFLAGGGEMGELTRAKDWSKTSLGPPEEWSRSLRTTLSIILNSRFPMFLWWGQDLICFYNDAYRPSLGQNGKHPSILGMPAKEAWSEIWDTIEPFIDRVRFHNEAIWFEDSLIPIFRNGHMEDVYWTFSYSPVHDDVDSIGGVLVTCTETTEKVLVKKQLEESERKLKLIIQQAPVAIGILRGPDYIVEMANARALELWGRCEIEVMDKPILEIMSELENQGIRQLLDNVYTTGKRFSAVELPVEILRNGKLETVFLNFSYEPLFDTQGNIDGILTVGIDVTAQVLAHKKIEANEEKLNIVIEASELGIWELDMRTNNAVYSNRYLEILGYPPNTILTHAQILKHLHPDDLPVRNNAFKVAIETGHLHFIGRLIWQDKSIHWFEGKGKLFYDDENNPYKLIGTIRDITAEKEYQQKLQESEELYRILVMQSPVPKAILKGKDHIVEMANEALLKNILKSKESEIIGRKLFDVFPELKSQKYASLLNQVFDSGIKWTEYESLLTLNSLEGENIYIDFEFAPLFERDNKISGIKLTAIDVTEKVEARKKIEDRETQLRLLSSDLENKIKKRTAELEQKNIDLEKMNKELQSFAYISSHDLQEPLRKIQTFASRLHAKEFDNLSEKGRDQFRRMQVSANRMQNLINDLLAYSRTETAERVFKKMNIGQIIAEVKEDLKEDIFEKNAVIETGDLHDVLIIPFQFRQLMQNLISNALKFSSPLRSPVVQISSRIAKGSSLNNSDLLSDKMYCHITISDNGIGFEQQYNVKIFELFQRLNSPSEYQGTGIGLAIVKKIVENHHGVIAAHSSYNHGATFDIYIPVN